MDERLNQICGLIYGQALGDAFGLTTEFESKLNINFILNKYKIQFKDKFPYPFTSHHASRWKKCDWTDDTDQMILIMRSLTENQLKPNIADFARKLKHWIEHGFTEVGDYRGLGLGYNVMQVTTHKDFLNNPYAASEEIWVRSKREAAPNGAIMRTSIVSCVDYYDLNIVKSNSIAFAKVTHFDPRCVASCICINMILSLMLQNCNYDKILEIAYCQTKHYLMEQQYDTNEFDDYFYNKSNSIDTLELSESSSIGYTYKCLGCGIYAFKMVHKHSKIKNSDKNCFDYKSIFNDVVCEGGDADTNMTVVGAVCGAYIGYSNLDKKWLSQMPDKAFLDKNVTKFLLLLGFSENKVNCFLNESETMQKRSLKCSLL